MGPARGSLFGGRAGRQSRRSERPAAGDADVGQDLIEIIGAGAGDLVHQVLQVIAQVPALAGIGVSRLWQKEALIEIQGVAEIPESRV